MNRKVIFASASLIAAIASHATSAADMRVPKPRAPVVPYYFTWTGCYVGGNGGSFVASKDFTLLETTPGLGYDGIATNGVSTIGTSLGTHSTSGGIGGVQAGCNYQMGSVVLGIQADRDWSQASGSHLDHFIPGALISSQTTSVSSLTGRLGYGGERFLGYLKVGGARAEDNYTIVGPAITVLGTPFGSAVASAKHSGWTIGVGGEYAFTNWLTGFIEYDYYPFDAKTVTFVSPAFGAFADIQVKEHKHVVKAGLNLKWGPDLMYPAW